ncbi:hypothetical protein TcYC6_0090780 [Trypanosoma cruzi]|nr:hypothetical protein TcYC6_0090780 [Trypanosoma cruzi]
MRYHAMIGRPWCLYIFYCLCLLLLAVLTNASSVEDTEGVWHSPSAVIKPTEGRARMLHEENGGPDNNEDETGRLKGEVARLRKLTEGQVTEAEAKEEEAKRHQAEEEAEKRHQAEEEAEKRHQAEEEAEKRHQAEEEAEKRHQAEEEAEKRHQAEEEAEKRHQAEEEAEKRRQAEEEAEKRRQAEEEAAKRHQAEEEAEKRRQAEKEAEKRHQAEEEAEKRHQAEEEAEKRRQAEEEAEKRRQAEEEAAKRRQAEEEAEKRRQAEEEAAKRQQAEEEAAKRRQAEEEAEKRRQAEEEAEKRRQAEEEAEKRRQAEEEAEKRRQAEEEAAKRRQAEEEAAKRRQAEEEAEKRRQAEEEAEKRRQSEKDTQNFLKRYNSEGNKGLEFLRILVFQTDELESSVNAAREEINKFCFLAGTISTSCHEALSDLHAATSRLAVAVNTLGKNLDIEDEPPRGSERKSNKTGQEGSRPFFGSQPHGEEEAIPAEIWGVWNWVGALLLIVLASVINRMREAPKEKREVDKIKFHGKNGEKEDQRGSHHSIGSEKSENGLPLNSALSQGANRNTAPGLVRRQPAVNSEVKTSFPALPKQPLVKPFLPGPGEESALQLGGTPKQHGVTGPVPFRPPQPVWLNQNGPSPSGPSSDLCHSLLVAENSVAAEKAKEDSAGSLGELRNPFLQRWS